MSTYRRYFDETKYMSFFINDIKLLETNSKIWDKVSKVIKKGFDSEPVYNEKCLITKIKSYERKISTNFYKKKMAEEGSDCIFLSMMLIDSVFKMDKNYYSQVLLEE